MTRFKRTLCAVMITVGISSSVFAGNIGGMRTTSAGNIGGMRTASTGNIGGLRTNGNIGGLRTNSRQDAEFPISETIITMLRLVLEFPLF